MSGVSPSAPGEQVLYHAVWGHAQGLEGPSPGVQRGAAGGRPRRSSLELSYGANHDRPLIVVVLSHSWGRARRNRTEHASHPMDRAEDLVEGLCKNLRNTLYSDEDHPVRWRFHRRFTRTKASNPGSVKWNKSDAYWKTATVCVVANAIMSL